MESELKGHMQLHVWANEAGVFAATPPRSKKRIWFQNSCHVCQLGKLSKQTSSVTLLKCLSMCYWFCKIESVVVAPWFLTKVTSSICWLLKFLPIGKVSVLFRQSRTEWGMADPCSSGALGQFVVSFWDWGHRGVYISPSSLGHWDSLK